MRSLLRGFKSLALSIRLCAKRSSCSFVHDFNSLSESVSKQFLLTSKISRFRRSPIPSSELMFCMCCSIVMRNEWRKIKGRVHLRFDRDPDVSSYDIESDDSTVRLICYILFEVLSVF